MSNAYSQSDYIGRIPITVVYCRWRPNSSLILSYTVTVMLTRKQQQKPPLMLMERLQYRHLSDKRDGYSYTSAPIRGTAYVVEVVTTSDDGNSA